MCQMFKIKKKKWFQLQKYPCFTFSVTMFHAWYMCHVLITTDVDTLRHIQICLHKVVPYFITADVSSSGFRPVNTRSQTVNSSLVLAAVWNTGPTVQLAVCSGAAGLTWSGWDAPLFITVIKKCYNLALRYSVYTSCLVFESPVRMPGIGYSGTLSFSSLC
jgi:hypothetical protein